MHKQLQAIITVLLLINPAIRVAMFARAVELNREAVMDKTKVQWRASW